MSKAHVHDFCGKNFKDLTNILNTLSYEDMIAYIDNCIRARKQDFDFHEKMNMIGHIKTDLEFEKTQDYTKPSPSRIKMLENTLKYYEEKRATHLIVIQILETRRLQIQKYYEKHGYKPVLKQTRVHNLFNPPSEKNVVLASFIIPPNTKRTKTKTKKNKNKKQKHATNDNTNALGNSKKSFSKRSPSKSL